MGSLFSELKRRNVFRVALFYLLIGWLILQVSDVLIPLLQLPDWAGRFTFFVLLLGFPLAVFFAWAFEITPEGLKLEKDVDRSQSITNKTGHKLDRVIIAVLAVAVIYFVIDKFVPSGTTDVTEPRAEVAASESSIAVLPFVDMSASSDQEYFADGIAEEILNALVMLEGIKVAGRTSSFSFKGRNEDLREIGETLGVAHVLEGSVRKQGDRVRVTAQLVNVDDGFHLWSETFDREMIDIFAIQDEIARSVAEALALQLNLDQGGSLIEAQTDNIDAYERYLEARALIARRGTDNLTRAIELLKEVTRLEPNYAEAWALLAQAHALSHYYEVADGPAAIAAAIASAKRALAINPDLALAYNALADAHRDYYEWAQAETNYRRALELNPDEVEASSQYAQFLMRTGYQREALHYSEKAVELDPVSSLNQTVLAMNYNNLQQTADAIKAIRLATALDEDLAFANWVEVMIRLDADELDAALAAQKRFSDKTGEQFGSDLLVTRLDDELQDGLNDPDALVSMMRAQKDELTRIGNASVITWSSYLGSPELALELLRDELEDDAYELDLTWFWGRGFRNLRQREGFRDLMRDTGLVDFWQERGWPDLCQPAGEDDFECD